MLTLRRRTDGSRSLRSLALLAGLALLVAACGGGAAPEAETAETPADQPTPATEAPEAEESPPVDMSGISFVSSSSKPGALGIPLFYAFDLMRDWGAEVQVEILTTTPGVQALVAGRTNLAPHGADELILGAAEGADVLAIGTTEAKMGYVLIAKTDVESVEGLQGRTLGMSGPAGFDALLSRFALRDAGLDPEADVSFVQVGGSPDRAAALLAGSVDAATIFVDDWLELKRRTEDVHLVLEMANLVPDFPSTVLFGMRDYITANSQMALGVACANLESHKWAQGDRQAFIDFGLELIEGSSAEAIGELYDFAMGVGMYPTTPEELLSVRGMGGLMEAMLETGDISEPVDVEQLVDRSYLDEAYELGCGQ